MWATDRQIEDTCDVFSQSTHISHGYTGNPEVTDYTLSACPEGIGFFHIFCTVFKEKSSEIQQNGFYLKKSITLLSLAKTINKVAEML